MLQTLTNFRSCLRKFVQFIHSDYVDAQANLLDKAERQVRESKIITATEKEAIIKARVGQTDTAELSSRVFSSSLNAMHLASAQKLSSSG